MGINAQTSVPKFTAGDTLTAANTNLLSNGIPVFGGTALRDASFGGSGEKVLAEGQFAYLEDTNTTQYYDGAAWQPVGTAPALVYITQATPSAVNTVSINNCFTSTYTNYRIIANFTAAVGDASLTARLRVSGTDATTNYSSQRVFGAVTSAGASQNQAGTDELYIADITGSTVTNNYISFELSSPALAQATSGMSIGGKSDVVQIVAIGHSTATAYDGITFLFGGTSVTGIIRVYGYQNS